MEDWWEKQQPGKGHKVIFNYLKSIILHRGNISTDANIPADWAQRQRNDQK